MGVRFLVLELKRSARAGKLKGKYQKLKPDKYSDKIITLGNLQEAYSSLVFVELATKLLNPASIGVGNS